MTTVGEHMTRPVVTVDCHQSLAEAEELMRARNVRHLAVLDRGKAVGVLSERDVFRLQAHKAIHPEVLPVMEAMTPEAYTVAPGTPLVVVVAEMARAGLGSALVADEGGLLGIFTASDGLRLLARLL